MLCEPNPYAAASSCWRRRTDDGRAASEACWPVDQNVDDRGLGLGQRIATIVIETPPPEQATQPLLHLREAVGPDGMNARALVRQRL